jgi:hypothetical protein
MGAKKYWRRISMNVEGNGTINYLNLNGVGQNIFGKKFGIN